MNGELIVLAITALKTAQTVSQEVIDLANGVRVEASKVACWTEEHEGMFQAEITRLTGSNLPPVPTVVPMAAAGTPASNGAHAADSSAAPVAQNEGAAAAPQATAAT